MDQAVYLDMSSIDTTHWWFLARRRIIRRLLERLGQRRDGEVLEVGCGAGGNLAMLGEFGRLHACELDEGMRAVAAARAGIAVPPGRLPDGLPVAGERFDLVAALDVIEHVEEDRASVAALAGLLRPGGRLVVTVPAFRWLWSSHDDVHQHKRRYRVGEMAGLMRDAGLAVERASYYNTLLFPAVAGARLIGRLAGRKGAADTALPPPALNRVLEEVFAVERHLVGRVPLPVGVSVIAVGRKPG